MDKELLSRSEVISLMSSSKTEEEWNDNCDLVKFVYKGRYPSFWFEAIMLSGLANEVMKRWKK